MNRVSFVIVILAVSCLNCANSALPSTIKVCHRNDPQISDCVIKAIQHLQPRLAIGDLGDGITIPKIEPFTIKSTQIGQTPEFRILLKNIIVRGASNFKIEKLRVNLNELKVDVLVGFPVLDIDGSYDLKIKLFGQNLDNRGEGSIKVENARARVAMKASLYNKNGQTYLKFDRFRVKVQPGILRKLKLSNLFNNDPNLVEAANSFINANSDFMLANVYPTIEKQLSEILTDAANELAATATFDELFPV
ncbi:hypothetical protein PVAND_014685 [Polypedilum vanderplanki]|uniref:Hemolymph juvenile hormone binding protein n=1 Tax=Polypedilum vanderplanki TaxID=319348 RepID=A0A9J6BAP3_POLVA|nr:hypothetical protein PVAND_014685 [Polypedilum vanderplanki]